jgi:hypothetical protein
MWETQAVTQAPKIVHLSAVENAAGRSARSLPPILLTVRQATKKFLTELVQGLFNNVDDALFELADRSRNDADQNMYFDSMREMRLQRKHVVTRFNQCIGDGFDDLFRAPSADSAGETPASADTMSLLKNDELEVSVAVSGIVSKITSQFSLPVVQLTRRVDTVCTGSEVTERNNPLGPQRITEAFVAAIDDLVLEIKARIIVLKLFERYVMEQLGPMYDEANRLLAEAGVLSDLRTSIVKKNPNARPPHAAPARGEAVRGGASRDSGGPTDEGFSMLQQLLAPVHGQGYGSGGGAGGAGGSSGVGGAGGSSGSGFGGGAVVTGPLITTHDLMTVLSAVQTDVSALPVDIDHPPNPVDLRELVLSQAVKVTGTSSGSMQRTDEDTVNLVGMLFDYILNDRNLAIPMKALIARLQIPMLKVAVLDKSFFSKSSHPARQLLNELSSAGIGWSSSAELKRDALYNKIESVVLRVLNNFAEDPSVFEKLVAELRQFVRRDQRRAQIVEQRVKESEAGRVKTISAKQTVERLVNQKASGLRLPEEVGRFISDTFSRVLVLLCVRNGTESQEWADTMTAFDDLLWSVQPLDNMDDVQRREQILPGLQAQLAEGMRLLNLAESDIESQLDVVARCLKMINDNDRAFLEDDQLEPVDLPELPLMDEIVLSSPDDRIVLADPDPAPDMVREINRLTEGVWVEMTNDANERIRCKLATIVQPGNRYIFVNRRGMKVAERNRMALAVELKEKTLTVLDESQVFDRALEAVIGNLRQMHRSPASR